MLEGPVSHIPIHQMGDRSPSTAITSRCPLDLEERLTLLHDGGSEGIIPRHPSVPSALDIHNPEPLAFAGLHDFSLRLAGPGDWVGST